MAAPPVPLPPAIAAQNKGPTIVAAICSVTAASTVFAALRLYVRARIMKKVYYDDWLIVFSVICGWASVAFAITAVKAGDGHHMGVLTMDQISKAILWTCVGFWPGILSFATPKLAVVALLCRILNPSRLHRIFMWILVGLCWASLNVCVPLLLTSCQPAQALWDVSITQKTCRDQWILVHYSMYAGGYSALVDLYLAIYPATVLFNLQMPFKKKLALSIALGIGSIATVVAIYKTTRLPVLASKDFSYDTPDLTIWTCIEGSVIIIATCIPTLQPLVETLRSRKRQNDKRHSYLNYGSSRSGPHPDIELGQKQRVITPRHDLDSIMDTQYDKADSQESILGPENKIPIVTQTERSPLERNDGITQTKEVRITYDEERSPASRQRDHPANWRPMK